MPRILLIIGVLALGAFVIYKIWEKVRKPKNACDKCDGLGYWEALRGRERCDQCRGTGVFPPSH